MFINNTVTRKPGAFIKTYMAESLRQDSRSLQATFGHIAAGIGGWRDSHPGCTEKYQNPGWYKHGGEAAWFIDRAVSPDGWSCRD